MVVSETALILNNRIRRGISWNVVNLIANKGMAICVRLILARLLVPEHFGLVSMTLVLLGFVKILMDFGLHNALIQRKRDEKTLIRYDSAFWFLIGSGFCWSLLAAIVGVPVLVWIFAEPELGTIGAVMSVSIWLYSFSIVPLVRLTRRMRFRNIVIAEVTGTIVGSIAAIILALNGAGVWSLVVQLLLAEALTALLLAIQSRWRPRLRFCGSSLMDLFKFSAYMLGSRSVYFARTNMDNVFVGVLLGPGSLGIYTMAYMLTEGLRQQLSATITRVMLPVYSQVQHQVDLVRPLYLSVTRLMTMVLFPFLLLVILYSGQFISFAFTAEWIQAALPMKILAGAGMVYAASGPASEVLQGIGRPDVLFRISLLNFLLIGVPAMWALSSLYGLPGTAGAVLLVFTGMRVCTYWFLRNRVNVSLGDLAWAVLPASVAVTVSLITAELILDQQGILTRILSVLIIFTVTAGFVFRGGLFPRKRP